MTNSDKPKRITTDEIALNVVWDWYGKATDDVTSQRNAKLQVLITDALNDFEKSIRADQYAKTRQDINVVFDAPPSHESGRFVESEDKFYRCGWCGRPCYENGRPINLNPPVLDSLISDNDLPEEATHGWCCEDDNREPELQGYVTREMAMDAGDVNLEGQPVYR